LSSSTLPKAAGQGKAVAVEGKAVSESKTEGGSLGATEGKHPSMLGEGGIGVVAKEEKGRVVPSKGELFIPYSFCNVISISYTCVTRASRLTGSFGFALL
jgi:hypothetical protein